MSGPDLNARLLDAHAKGDRRAIARAYAEAAHDAEAGGDIDRAAFFLTHAWIFALDCGDNSAPGYRTKLATWGRVDGDDE